jgi:hypothetical protein
MRSMVIGLALALVPMLPAVGHETQPSGQLRVTLGWAEEPAYTNTLNAVEVALAAADGTPVADPAALLRVQVTFGEASVVLGLLPGDRPGTYAAALVPTRPGTYTFHLTGTVRGEGVDITSTCSERTFDCVTDAAELQFPARDPSDERFAERLERESRRLARARDTAAQARLLGVGALVLAAVALGTAVASRRRRSLRGD